MLLLSDPHVAAVPVRDCGEALVDLRDGSGGLLVDTRKKDPVGAWARIRVGVRDRLRTAQDDLPDGVRLTVGDGVQTPHGLGLRVHRAAPQSKRTSRAVLGSNKTHRSRTVPVPAAVAQYVLSRTTNAASTDYLFPTPSGLIWTNTNFRLRCKWTASTRAAGLAGTTIHDLRHTAASLLIAAGADVKAVQTILGHASATMTMDLYGHLFSDAPWRAMERLPKSTDHSLTISYLDAPETGTTDPISGL